MDQKGQDYSQLTDMAWLTNLMFFTDLTAHFKELNKKTPKFWKNSRNDVFRYQNI
jgi:hypothetical protein